MPSTSATIGAGSGGTGHGPPGVPATMVRRPRLLHRLAAARTHRLTVVAGPPGCGKTVALADWAASACPDPVLWLSLDAADPVELGPLGLWRRLVAGLRGFQLSLGRAAEELSDAEGLLDAGDPDPRELLPLVVAELWRCPPAVVVIDDFHLVTNPAAALFPSLVLDLPPHVHLVLAGREEPAFPLHRLRLGGELVEITDRDLRFDRGEAAALLAGLGVRLSAAEVAQLGRAVEGWAAGLHLAGRFLQGEADPRGAVGHFGGATALVAEYFVREVLDRLPPGHVRFLVDTSVLGELTPPLCAEVTRRQDAQAVLQDLIGRNLFLARAGDGSQAYRYHPLFAGFLQHRLALEGPERAQGVHRRAAAWFGRSGDLGRAVGHLVAGSAPDAALALVTGEVLAHLERGVTWDGASLFLPGVPRAWLEEDPVRLYVAAAALLCGSRLDEARWWLHRLEATLGPGPERAGLLARAAFLWLVHDEAVADAAGVLAQGAVVGEAMGPDQTLAPLPGELGRRHSWLAALDGVIAARLPVVLARAHCWRGEHQAARAVLCRVSRRTQVSSGGGYWAVLGTVALAEGRLGEAHTLAQRALAETGGQDAGASAAAYDARVALGALYLERDELAAAEEQ
ncbi:MAG TPA: hypothetical protein VE152_02215, partial [Acidimicrobiales bacterium]|nr:hypothetical protein [Acidimicrobiales bacterium]